MIIMKPTHSHSGSVMSSHVGSQTAIQAVIGFFFSLTGALVSKIQDVKKHLSENKKFYLGVGVGIVVGVVITPKVVQVIYKSPGSTQTVVRRMHPGNVIMCEQTGEIFASQNRAAEVFNVSRQNMAAHLHGKLPDVNGLTFKKLGEAQSV